MTSAVEKIVSYFKWEYFGFFVYDFNDKTKGYSDCSLVLGPYVKSQSDNGTGVYETFENVPFLVLKEKLLRLKEKSRSKLSF